MTTQEQIELDSSFAPATSNTTVSLGEVNVVADDVTNDTRGENTPPEMIFHPLLRFMMVAAAFWHPSIASEDRKIPVWFRVYRVIVWVAYIYVPICNGLLLLVWGNGANLLGTPSTTVAIVLENAIYLVFGISSYFMAHFCHNGLLSRVLAHIRPSDPKKTTSLKRWSMLASLPACVVGATTTIVFFVVFLAIAIVSIVSSGPSVVLLPFLESSILLFPFVFTTPFVSLAVVATLYQGLSLQLQQHFEDCSHGFEDNSDARAAYLKAWSELLEVSRQLNVVTLPVLGLFSTTSIIAIGAFVTFFSTSPNDVVGFLVLGVILLVCFFVPFLTAAFATRNFTRLNELLTKIVCKQKEVDGSAQHGDGASGNVLMTLLCHTRRDGVLIGGLTITPGMAVKVVYSLVGFVSVLSRFQ